MAASPAACTGFRVYFFSAASSAARSWSNWRRVQWRAHGPIWWRRARRRARRRAQGSARGSYVSSRHSGVFWFSASKHPARIGLSLRTVYSLAFHLDSGLVVPLVVLLCGCGFA